MMLRRALPLAAAVAFVFLFDLVPPPPDTGSYIVQAADLETARHRVEAVGGRVTHELRIISAVSARLTETQVARLRRSPGVLKIFRDAPVRTAKSYAGKKNRPDTEYPTLIGAEALHQVGVDGTGVTIAFVDSGLYPNGRDMEGLRDSSAGRSRIVAQYDAILDVELAGSSTSDGNGHGSHVASVAVSSLADRDGRYNGVAPGADLVSVKAFGDDGMGTYGDVIRSLGWVVANRNRYGIRVLNLSFSAAPRSFYWDDPLAQAVMRAWDAGILVVASAGNTGPDPMTIGVPGNVPYVLTVGAMTDGYTPDDPTDDRLTTFSAAGPTAAGFVKPELVAPGGHLLGLMHGESRIAEEHPEFHSGSYYFTMSGTSQAAAVVSGAAALVLQTAPWLSPDQVKCRLMASARPAVDDDGDLAYTVFQQGAGRVDAAGAVASSASGCANRGLDLALDLAGLAHFRGPALRDDGGYAIEGLEGDGYAWNDFDAEAFGSGFAWNDGYAWNDGFAWNDGAIWNGTDPLLSDGYAWNDAYVWNDTEAAGINAWVPQE